MGTSMAPNYANLSLDNFEQNFLCDYFPASFIIRAGAGIQIPKYISAFLAILDLKSVTVTYTFLIPMGELVNEGKHLK